jgi:hypothetical protein
MSKKVISRFDRIIKTLIASCEASGRARAQRHYKQLSRADCTAGCFQASTVATRAVRSALL